LHSIFKDNLSKFIVLISAIYLPMAVRHDHGLFKKSNIQQLNQLHKIEYVLSITNQDYKVYDGNILFNLFRDDIDSFWYYVEENNCLDSYKTIADYDVYDSISSKKPKGISTFSIKNPEDPRIKYYYRRSEKYNNLLIRVEQ